MYEANNVATLCFSSKQIMKIMSQGINNLDCYLLQQKMHMPCRPSITDSFVHSRKSGEPTVDCFLSNISDSEEAKTMHSTMR
jgi:hypothetical protein